MNFPDAPKKTVLIIGAYGLIGRGIAQRLVQDGHDIVGVGRDIGTGKQVLPSVRWIAGDLRNLTDPAAWQEHLRGIDAVVNCSGALQDGPEDDLEAVHHHAVAALARACADIDITLVQISAVGAGEDATTEFLRSKGRGDAAIRTAGGRFHIFRPGLVLARHSYGGTTLMRMLAAVPIIQPIALPKAKIQTVDLRDVAGAVSAAMAGQIPNGFVGDLVEDQAHDLADVVAAMRGWLGFAPARFRLVLPRFCVKGVRYLADQLGRLGWRSPLRSTAEQVLADGVTGVPGQLTQFGVPAPKALGDTLASMPAMAEDRLFSRMALLMPVLMAVLILFWALSGLIGFVRVGAAAQVLTDVGWPWALAVASVLFWAVVDLAIAVGLAYRPWAKRACWAAVGVSVFYLGASSVFVPHLWLDPLGPLVKVLPSIVLALVARIALETR